MQEEIKRRTKELAMAIIRMASDVPKSIPNNILMQQLIRSGTSVGANYRAACRGRSKAEFIAKMGIVEEEADESLYWLELLADNNNHRRERITTISREMREILAITVASIKTARRSTS